MFTPVCRCLLIWVIHFHIDTNKECHTQNITSQSASSKKQIAPLTDTMPTYSETKKHVNKYTLLSKTTIRFVQRNCNRRNI